MLVGILVSSHPYILRFMRACLYTCILASSHPHTLRFIRACWYPCILAPSHLHILRFMCIWLYPHVLTSLCHYTQVCVYLFVSSHPHILITSGSYVLVGILASSYPQIHVCFLLSLHPLILISFLYIILIYISQTNIYINTLKKNSCNLQYNKRIKPTRYWTQH